MTRVRAAALALGVAMPLGSGWAAAAEPPTLSPEEIVALCALLDEDAVTTRFDAAIIDRYRIECDAYREVLPAGEPSTSAPAPSPEPSPSPTTTPLPAPSAPAPPVERSAGSQTAPQTDPVPVDASLDTGTSDAPEAGETAPQRDPDDYVAESSVPGFELPPMDYADLLVPEAAPQFASSSMSATDPASPGEADMAAAGSAVALSTGQDRFPIGGLLAAALVSLIGAGLIRSYLMKRS